MYTEELSAEALARIAYEFALHELEYGLRDVAEKLTRPEPPPADQVRP